MRRQQVFPLAAFFFCEKKIVGVIFFKIGVFMLSCAVCLCGMFFVWPISENQKVLYKKENLYA